MNKLIFDKDTNSWIFQCPHCNMFILVPNNELNCKIFRHGCLKASGAQIDPHSTKEQCDNLKNSDSVDGCCKPFQIISINNELFAICCNYI